MRARSIWTGKGVKLAYITDLRVRVPLRVLRNPAHRIVGICVGAWDGNQMKVSMMTEPVIFALRGLDDLLGLLGRRRLRV